MSFYRFLLFGFGHPLSAQARDQFKKAANIPGVCGVSGSCWCYKSTAEEVFAGRSEAALHDRKGLRNSVLWERCFTLDM